MKQIDQIGKVGAARLSVISNAILTILKLTTGLLSGSVGVVSEAAHSGSDLIASFIALFSVRMSNRPADEEHPYGHGKVESISGILEAMLILLAACTIIYTAVEKLLRPLVLPAVAWGMAVMGLSVAVNIGVSYVLFKVARATDSLALLADAEHLRTDVLTSLGVLVGLVLIKVTHWAALDPIIGIVVAMIIIWIGMQLIKDGLRSLMDVRLPESDLQKIYDALAEEPRILGYHKLRTRKSGSTRYIDFHIQVDDNLSLVDAHSLTEKLEDKIRNTLPNVEVVIHTEPYSDEMRHWREYHTGAPIQSPRPGRGHGWGRIRKQEHHTDTSVHPPKPASKRQNPPTKPAI